MDQILAQTIVAVGAVLAALIAGAFSYLNLIISKEQKISEFRQAWIDALREDIAQYVAAISLLLSAHSALERQKSGAPSWADHIKTIEAAFDKASRAYTAIALRINPNDKNRELKVLNVDFLTAVNAVRMAARERRYEEARNMADELQVKAQPILKLEWERVKSGEPIFRASRYIAGAILIVAMGVGGALAAKLFSF